MRRFERRSRTVHERQLCDSVNNARRLSTRTVQVQVRRETVGSTNFGGKVQHEGMRHAQTNCSVDVIRSEWMAISAPNTQGLERRRLFSTCEERRLILDVCCSLQSIIGPTEMSLNAWHQFSRQNQLMFSIVRERTNVLRSRTLYAIENMQLCHSRNRRNQLEGMCGHHLFMQRSDIA